MSRLTAALRNAPEHLKALARALFWTFASTLFASLLLLVVFRPDWIFSPAEGTDKQIFDIGRSIGISISLAGAALSLGFGYASLYNMYRVEADLGPMNLELPIPNPSMPWWLIWISWHAKILGLIAVAVGTLIGLTIFR